MALNPHLDDIETDILYHFGLNTRDYDMKGMFGDVKFVCIGGSTRRMTQFASYVQTELGLDDLPPAVNLAASTDRYVLYKVGPVLIADHGIGVPSLCVMLHELLKLLHYACCTDVMLIRIGTCGGLGIDAGTVVVSDSTVDATLSRNFNSIILGKKVSRPAMVDTDLVTELLNQGRPSDSFTVEQGRTLCTDDFYEGQGRLDGAFCEFSEAEHMKYLRRLYDQGIRNIEMESHCFAAMCHHAAHKCAIVCVTIVNRFHGDQVTATADILHQWEWYPATLVVRLIRSRLGIKTNPHKEYCHMA